MVGFTTHQRTQRNWLTFLYFFLDISVTNAHILINLARTRELNRLLDSGQLSESDILSHHLARPVPAIEFRQTLFRNLSLAGLKVKVRKSRHGSNYRYISKTPRIYFTKKNKPHIPLQKEVVNDGESPVVDHYLQRMEKRRECCICRYDFRKGNTNGRRRPKLSQFECRSCQPHSALCGGNTECFSRWHNIVGLLLMIKKTIRAYSELHIGLIMI